MDQLPIPPLQPGHLLLSAPFLSDENFMRAVILLCEPSDSCTFGFVINKPSILNLGDLMQELNFLDCEVYMGGPVEQNTLHFIYFGTQLIPGSQSLGKEIWWGGEFSALVEALKIGKLTKNQVRFFLGYSGWEQGQLQAELKEDSWVVFTKQVSLPIFERPADQLWKELMKGMGGAFEIQSNYPSDPRLN